MIHVFKRQFTISKLQTEMFYRKYCVRYKIKRLWKLCQKGDFSPEKEDEGHFVHVL